jgi:hypothetical protein
MLLKCLERFEIIWRKWLRAELRNQGPTMYFSFLTIGEIWKKV